MRHASLQVHRGQDERCPGMLVFVEDLEPGPIREVACDRCEYIGGVPRRELSPENPPGGSRETAPF